jgi:predicted GNAT family N-acyltransferase
LRKTELFEAYPWKRAYRESKENQECQKSKHFSITQNDALLCCLRANSVAKQMNEMRLGFEATRGILWKNY